MADFQGDKKEYYGEHFSGIDASGEAFREKEFEGCNFKDCDLSEVSFRSCRFIDCNFENCNLSLTDFSYSRFTDVIFDHCKLVGVDWTKLNWPNLVLSSPLHFKQCILNDASFFGLNIEEIVIEGCKAHDADFRDAKMGQSNLTYTDFRHALFNKTGLRNADFSEAENYDIDIFNNDIKGAKFCRDQAVNLLVGLGIELVD